MSKELNELEANSPSQPQERGEAVAWMTNDGRVCSDLTKREAMTAVTQAAYCIPLYAHPTPDAGRVAELEKQLADLRDYHMGHVSGAQRCYDEFMARIAALESRLAESREREGRMREAVRENHQWHLDYDDIDGYAGSALCETNMAVLATENEKRAQLRLVGYVRTVDIEDLNEDRNLFVVTECPFEDWTPLFYRPKEE